MIRRVILLCLLSFVLSSSSFVGCNAGDKIDDIVDDVVDNPGRGDIDRAKLGVNNFFLDREIFGSIDDQFSEIRNTLKIPFVRILIAWTDGLQPSPDSELNFGFSDDILNSIPAGTDVLVVLSHTPSWMTNSANWVGGDPRQTFVDEFVRPVVRRYAGRRGIVGWEIFNEPDLPTVASDDSLGLTNPDNYADLLKRAFPVVRSLDPTRLVVMAATRSIQQDFPNAFNYNVRLRDLGVQDFTDIWNIHFYGKQYEKLSSIVAFLNELRVPVWVTESGEQGPNNQRAYVEEAWPLLQKRIPSIQRFYYYQFTSTAPIEQNFGLRTNDPGFPVSDLYVFLRDNAP